MTPSTRRRWIAGALILITLGGASLAASAWWLAGTFVASANRSVPMPAEFVSVSIPGDGHAIAASWRDLGADSPAVLVIHGAGGSRQSALPRARLLLAAGFSVLLIDLQAHGETPGDRITMGWRESADVRAAREWLRASAPGRKLGAVGASLGGASLLLGPQPVGFDAVVVEATYSRLRHAIENRMQVRSGPFGRVMTPLLAWQVKPRLGVSVDELEPIRRITHVGAPVLVVGGSRDAYTPEPETRDLFAAAREPKQLWIVDGAVHQDFSVFDPSGYEERVVGFLRRHLR